MPVPPPQTPPGSAQPQGNSSGGSGTKGPVQGQTGPGGLSSGAKTGVNMPGRTGNGGKQDV